MARLKREKGFQATRFEMLRPRFTTYYDIVRKYDFQKFTTPFWQEGVSTLESAFLPAPRISFLREPFMMQTMVDTRRGIWRFQLDFIEKRLEEDKLRDVLTEDYVGRPFLLRSKYLTSQTTVNQLFHVASFLDATKCSLDSISTCVEWGGGYGNLAKIFCRLKHGKVTYVILDLPIMSCLQWIYLSSIMGKDRVKLLLGPDEKITEGLVNILPVCFVDRKDLAADLFISTWALSESSSYSQDFVASCRLFGARHVLLAYQESSSKFPYAQRLAEIVTELTIKKENIPLTPGGYYAFS